MLQFTVAVGIGVGGAIFVLKRRRSRKPSARQREFISKQQGTMIPLSGYLVESACYLLSNSLDERKQDVWRFSDNHPARFAPAVISTIVTAFDAWLNKLVGYSRSTISEDAIANLISREIPEKYREIGREIAGTSISVPSDLKLLHKLRHEIVHFLPYVQDISSGKTLPDWLGELKKKRLLITSGNPVAEFHFTQRLQSYALAYWACETAGNAARTLATAMGGKGAAGHAAKMGADNFELYRQLTSPTGLGEFDERFGLILSR
ncbi:MAG: hypothetical protein HYX25_10150 [Candidatus Solibacter usitatus]|nr:hypothetical protein [Candidatus Solibacter usitatus]